jgi:hypothetical protein
MSTFFASSRCSLPISLLPIVPDLAAEGKGSNETESEMSARIRRVEIQPQCHSSVLATARAYVVYITTPGQIVAVGPKRSTGGLQGDGCSGASNNHKSKLLAIQRGSTF